MHRCPYPLLYKMVDYVIHIIILRHYVLNKMCLSLYFIVYVVTMLLQGEVEQLMTAARDGDVPTLLTLIQDKKIHVDTCGPNDLKWVS